MLGYSVMQQAAVHTTHLVHYVSRESCFHYILYGSKRVLKDWQKTKENARLDIHGKQRSQNKRNLQVKDPSKTEAVLRDEETEDKSHQKDAEDEFSKSQ